MVCQVEIDEKRYLTDVSLGGLVGKAGAGIDIPEEALVGFVHEKMRAYRLSEDGQALIFDPEKWAEIDPANFPIPPSVEERIAALEALYLETILGGGI